MKKLPQVTFLLFKFSNIAVPLPLCVLFHTSIKNLISRVFVSQGEGTSVPGKGRACQQDASFLHTLFQGFP